MTGLTALWLPIVLSAVLVFLVSWVLHVLLPWHKGDFLAVPSEDRVMDALRPFGIPPGEYMVPRPPSMEDCKKPEWKEKFAKGPVLMMTVLPNGMMSMGKPLMQWFIYSIVVSLFAAYVAGRALPAGTEYLPVFRFAGVTAFLAYTAALWQASIWHGRSWATTFRSSVDGLIYGCLTAGVFGWLWPA